MGTPNPSSHWQREPAPPSPNVQLWRWCWVFCALCSVLPGTGSSGTYAAPWHYTGTRGCSRALLVPVPEELCRVWHCWVETRPQSLPFLMGTDPVSHYWLLLSWFYGEAFLHLVGCFVWKEKNTFRVFRTQWRKCEEKYALFEKNRGYLKRTIKPRGF